ncbi:MAG TPA: flagellar motor switch protein FliN [Candidatus Brocadiia bacterium]|nr:flagellar motor switch protein FliN [Planctomycetota bacterium]MDO8092217.1 flagellar motor switch protein FliN [Candidatus Brocadiales bacterium]
MDETKSVINPPQAEQAMSDAVQDAGDENIDTQIKAVQFPQLTQNPQGGRGNRNLDLILDVSVPVSVELGRASMFVKDILSLAYGSVVELDRLAGSPVDLLVRGKLLAQGEVVVVEENFGIKITNICGSEERVKNLA